jgi:hypothetical protein
MCSGTATFVASCASSRGVEACVLSLFNISLSRGRPACFPGKDTTDNGQRTTLDIQDSSLEHLDWYGVARNLQLLEALRSNPGGEEIALGHPVFVHPRLFETE